MNRVVGPIAFMLMVAQFAVVGLLMWRVSRWRTWAPLKRLVFWVLVIILGMMLWNLVGAIMTISEQRRL